MDILVCPILVHPLVPLTNKNVKFEFLGQSQSFIGQSQSQKFDWHKLKAKADFWSKLIF
jgi:hypothetical protein